MTCDLDAAKRTSDTTHRVSRASRGSALRGERPSRAVFFTAVASTAVSAVFHVLAIVLAAVLGREVSTIVGMEGERIDHCERDEKKSTVAN